MLAAHLTVSHVAYFEEPRSEGESLWGQDFWRGRARVARDMLGERKWCQQKQGKGSRRDPSSWYRVTGNFYIAIHSKVFGGFQRGVLVGILRDFSDQPNKALRPERPFTRVSGARNPKKSRKESFWVSAKKSLKIPEKSKNTRKIPNLDLFRCFSTFSGIFGDFFADPQKDSFRDFLGFRARRARRLL